MQNINPAALIIKTELRFIFPRANGRYGEESESVSIWKQSVNACPNPYDKKDAKKINIICVTGNSGAKDIPAIPVIPETNSR